MNYKYNKTKRKKTNKKGKKSNKGNKYKRKTQKKLIKDKCSPSKKLTYSCYDKYVLNILKNAWNKKNPKNKIKSKTPKQIWIQLKNKNKKCNRESCWLDQPFIKDTNLKLKIKHNNFAPDYPKSWLKNSSEWLSSLDILNVMKQYEKEYNNFKFIGPSPIDYDTKQYSNNCVCNNLCNFNLQNEIANNNTKIGIVFNLDTHDNPGSHWVALFINTNKKNIYYFDSYGEPIPLNINKLVKNIQKQAKNNGIKYNYFYNDNRHQFKNTECGMYCLYFIISMLKNKSFNYFLDNDISDLFVFKKRKEYFNF